MVTDHTHLQWWTVMPHILQVSNCDPSSSSSVRLLRCDRDAGSWIDDLWTATYQNIRFILYKNIHILVYTVSISIYMYMMLINMTRIPYALNNQINGLVKYLFCIIR